MIDVQDLRPTDQGAGVGHDDDVAVQHGDVLSFQDVCHAVPEGLAGIEARVMLLCVKRPWRVSFRVFGGGCG